MAKAKKTDAQPYLRVEGLVKKFGPFTALAGVDLDVYPGEVHALLGDNGAGKSTLIKTLAGVHQPTEGQLYIEGQPVNFRTPRDASAAGIGTVYQDLGPEPVDVSDTKLLHGPRTGQPFWCDGQ